MFIVDSSDAQKKVDSLITERDKAINDKLALEKEISRQSDVPIILVLGGTPTLHIVDEHVISFTPTNTKFQKNALSHIK